MTRSGYITVKRVKAEKLRLPGRGILLVCLSAMLLFVICSVLRNTCEQTRDELIETLKNGKTIIETNKALKMELLAITQKGYVEFAAEERLGLKKPTEAEVVIVK
jgi:hypothetical protein